MIPRVHRTTEELEAGLVEIRRAPKAEGTVELIVRRPAVEAREILDCGQLDTAVGLVGDTWNQRESRRTPDRSPHPEQQLTLMRTRVIALLVPDPNDWPLAGDQFYVDLDLGAENLPPGTRLAIGSAVIEVSTLPHTGCAKFTTRFGSAATAWANSPVGRALNLRGINARVITPGEVRRGDAIRKL